MSEIQGIFISIVGSLMRMYKDKIKEADDILFKETGKHWNELKADGWVDMKYYKLFLDAYSKGSITGDKAWLTLGKTIFPSMLEGIRQTG